MAKHKPKHQHKPSASASLPRPSGPQALGLKAFHIANYSEAIRQWNELEPEKHPELRAAIAEAYFRRAVMARGAEADPVEDLRHAIDMLPDDSRSWYHLGLALHRADRIEEARHAYERATGIGSKRRGLGFTRGLAELEANPGLALDELPWMSPESRAALEPIAALLRGAPQAVQEILAGENAPKTPGGPDAISALWQGLAQLACGDAERARSLLAPHKGQRLPAGMEPVRAFYHGVAAVLTDDTQAALNIWQENARDGATAHAAGLTPSQQQIISRLCAQRVLALQNEGQWKAALDQIHVALTLSPNDLWLLKAALIASNRLAAAARQAGDWSAAVIHWETMGGILRAHPQLGPLAPVLRNLAVAREALEQWEMAAEVWSAVLEAMPRRRGRAAKKPVETPDAIAQEDQIPWLRRRILDNYKRAGRPDEAISYYKQAVKSDADNLDLRLELASALLANDQTIAARNEVKRILDKDPQHLDAYLLQAQIHQDRHDDYAAEQSLRRVLEIDPKHDMARRAIAHLMLERGMDAFNYGQYLLAHRVYTEALTFAPDDVQLLVFLGETEFALRNSQGARARFDAALATGQPRAYIAVFTSWVRRKEEKEARQIVLQAQTAGVASPALSIDFGIACLLVNDAPPPDTRTRKTSARPETLKWEEWGQELVREGLAGTEDKAAVLQHLISKLGSKRIDLALNYARQLVELAPDDPQNYLGYALLQAITGDVKGGKATLTQAERLARQLGQMELVAEIAEVRKEMGSPMFAMMAPMLAFGDPDLFD